MSPAKWVKRVMARSSTTIKPGEVRNPTGRPKRDLVLAEMARQFTQEAVDTVVKAMRSKKAGWNVKVAAAGELLNRGWGRAPQTINLGGGVKLHYNLSGVSKDEQVALTRRLMALRSGENHEN